MSNHRTTQGSAAKPDTVAPDSLASLLVELQAAVEQQRGHKALGLAKLLRKHPAYGPQHTSLVARAYEVRMAEMLAAAQHKSAQELLQLLATQQPEVAALISSRPTLLVELGGGAGSLLARYGLDAALTEEVDTWIRRDCRDPRPLAQHPHLTAGHALKVAAAAILRAWEEVESGASAEAYARLPEVVGRRSPFIAWRLFIQALQAAYAGHDVEAPAFLDRIATDSAVRPLADILRRILAGEPPCTPRERILHAKIVAPSLHGALAQIDQHLAAGELTESRQLLDELFRQPIWTGRKQLFSEMAARYLLAATPTINRICKERGSFNKADELYLSFRRNPQFAASLAKFLYWDDSDCVEDWEQVIQFSKPPPLAMALIYDRLATIRLTRNGGDPDDDDDDDDDDYYDVPRMRRNETVAHACREAAKLWQQSAQCFPLRETFVHWHTAAQHNEVDVEFALEEWLRVFPEDVTPMLELTALFRANRTPQKALSMFKRLESVARGRPEVEALRPLLRLDSAAGRLTRGMYAAAEKDLDEITPDAPEFIRVTCATLRWMCAMRSGGDAVARRAAWEAAGHPLWAYQAVCVLERQWRAQVSAELTEVDARVAAQALAAPAQLVSDFAKLAALPDVVWSLKYQFPIGAVIVAACRDRSADADAVWALLQGIFNPQLLSKQGARTLFWALTGNGLARRDARTPEYLAYRALLYDPLLMPPDDKPDFDAVADRVDECLAVADHLAHASGRMEAVQTVEALTRYFHVTTNFKRQEARLTDKFRARVIEQEIAIGAWADVPDRLKRKEQVQRSGFDLLSKFKRKQRATRPRTSPPAPEPDIKQPELW
ncbi:MAG: hypothetical protein WCR06_03120 [bacterium]